MSMKERKNQHFKRWFIVLNKVSYKAYQIFIVSKIYFYSSIQKSEFQSKLAFLQNVLV